jgi:hypothetical protein
MSLKPLRGLFSKGYEHFVMVRKVEGARRMVATAAVPLLLALLSAVQLSTSQHAAEFLMLPPFAVIVYLIFRAPEDESASLRSIVLLPVIAAAVGQASWHYLGLTPAGVAIAAITVLVTQATLRADMPPALALAVLAMLLRAQGPWYVLGVLEGTLIIFAVFRLWHRFAPIAWR